MKDLNNVTLIGRLTKDAELKHTSSEYPIAGFSLAVNRMGKDGNGNYTDEVSFFDVFLFGKQAESLAQYLLKGKRVAVSGGLEQQRWQSDGQNRSKIVINANTIQLLGGEKKQFKENDDF